MVIMIKAELCDDRCQHRAQDMAQGYHHFRHTLGAGGADEILRQHLDGGLHLAHTISAIGWKDGTISGSGSARRRRRPAMRTLTPGRRTMRPLSAAGPQRRPGSPGEEERRSEDSIVEAAVLVHRGDHAERNGNDVVGMMEQSAPA